ncbi:MAG: hypothetical protein FWG02_11820 [Holophagaceae bacterium]|nr:hypothetical protein [Holophagaceae bacterium]
MDIDRFIDLVRNYGWQGMAIWGVLLSHAILWVGILRLHISLLRENAPWNECVGKIRSAHLRIVGGATEMDTLKGHSYAPLVDKLIALHMQDTNGDIFVRWLLLRWKIKDGLRPYWIRWGHLVIGFGIVLWFMYGLRIDIGIEPLMRTPGDPRLLWVWLGYAMVIAWQLVRLQGNLERIQRVLLVPERDEL